MVTIDQYWLTFLISVALPMVVALVTKQAASGTVKSLVLLALSAITGTLTMIAQAGGGPFDWKKALTMTIVAFVIAVGSHYGLLKEVTLTGSDGKIQSAVPGGIG